MEIVGLLLAVLIGLSLGLIGGGGSILTVPVLVYVMHISPVLATSYSLFIVGSTSLIGASDYFRNKQIDIKSAIAFSIPSLTSVFLTRKFLLPSIPNHVFSISEFEFSKDMLIMLVFAGLMLFASTSMIRQQQVFIKLRNKSGDETSFNYPLIFVEGIIVGLLTGFVGAGGGFLIIPALVLFAGIPMKKAVGTSLLIIAINSLIGFTGDLIHGTVVDWKLILGFSCIAFGGILIGSYLSKFMEGTKLKPAFGWFTLLMGIFIIIKEILIGLN
jgi:hypothetical protein